MFPKLKVPIIKILSPFTILTGNYLMFINYKDLLKSNYRLFRFFFWLVIWEKFMHVKLKILFPVINPFVFVLNVKI